MYPYMSKPKNERNFTVPQNLIKELLTDSELRMVQQRFLIANLLEEGLTIRQIAEEVKVGTDTVVRTAKLLVQRNIQKLITHKDSTKKTSWVFGKSE